VVFLALADNKKKAIRAAFKDFEDFTCLRFKERKDENDYIEFQKKIKGYGAYFYEYNVDVETPERPNNKVRSEKKQHSTGFFRIL